MTIYTNECKYSKSPNLPRRGPVLSQPRITPPPPIRSPPRLLRRGIARPPSRPPLRLFGQRLARSLLPVPPRPPETLLLLPAPKARPPPGSGARSRPPTGRVLAQKEPLHL